MVNRIAFVLLLMPFCVYVAQLSAAAQAKGDPSKADVEAFQGTWNFVSMEMDGKKETGGDGTITFQGDKFEVKAANMVVQAGTQKLDASKNPKTVDATVSEGEGKGTTMLGIYEVKGDSLKACFDPMGKKRPTEFKAPAESGLMLVELKRESKKK